VTIKPLTWLDAPLVMEDDEMTLQQPNYPPASPKTPWHRSWFCKRRGKLLAAFPAGVPSFLGTTAIKAPAGNCSCISGIPAVHRH